MPQSFKKSFLSPSLTLQLDHWSEDDKESLEPHLKMFQDLG